MITLPLALLFVKFHSQLESDRRRTLLPNGSSIQVERFPGANSISVQLFVNARNTPETPVSNGWRHLLEHLVAKGTSRDLDLRLESMGCFLNAHTLREVMQFEISAPKSQLAFALESLAEVMQMPAIRKEEILKEAQIISEESKLRNPEESLASEAWEAAFGTDGIDAFGDPENLKTATVTQLSAIHRRMFVGKNLTVSISGDIEVDEATELAKRLVARVPEGETQTQKDRNPNGASEIESGVPGSAVAAFVPGWKSPRLAWTLSAGLALASQISNPFVTYTPSGRKGLIVIGSTRQGELLKSIETAKPTQLFYVGRSLARSWVEGQLRGVRGSAYFRGLLLSLSPNLNPELVLESLDQMNLADFKIGLEAFRSEKSVTVRGKP